MGAKLCTLKNLYLMTVHCTQLKVIVEHYTQTT